AALLRICKDIEQKPGVAAYVDDEFVTAFYDRAELVAKVVELTDGESDRWFAPEQVARKAAAVRIGQRGQARQVEHRRTDVRNGDRRGDTGRNNTRRVEDDGNPKDFVEEGVSVQSSRAAVVAQVLSVVAKDDHNRIREVATSLDLLQE